MASLVCGSGVPQLIQGPGPGKLVGKRDNSAADTEQAVTGLRVGDIAHLVFRDIEQFRQLARSVAAWLRSTRNSLLANMSRAVSERRHSSTFCVAAVRAAPYLRNRFHAL